MITEKEFGKYTKIQIIEGPITRIEKVTGTTFYTTIYIEDAFFKVGGDIPCQVGWNTKAAIIKHFKDEYIFWYEINNGIKTFPNKGSKSVEELIDQYYGEIYQCKTKKGLWQFLSGLFCVILFFALLFLGTGFFKSVGITAGAGIILTILLARKKSISMKSTDPELYKFFIDNI